MAMVVQFLHLMRIWLEHSGQLRDMVKKKDIITLGWALIVGWILFRQLFYCPNWTF